MAATLYGVAVLCVCALLGWVVITRYPQVHIMFGGRSHPANDVIIVGGGLAGISAAIEATRHGSKVTIIEKEKNLGGNSAKATSGINGVGTEGQRLKEVDDSVEDFIKDILKSGDGLSNPQLVRTLAESSGSALEFLQTFNLELTDVVQLGGHSARRTHRFPPTADGKPVPVGFTILNTLKKYLASDEMKYQVTVLTNCEFLSLIKDEGRVVGVEFRTQENEIHRLSGVVILTAGGYGNDHTDNSLLAKHVPHLASYPTTNGPWATGDILKATADLGLSLVHMDKVQIHPTGFVDSKDPTFHTKFLAPEALRGCGALLVDHKGKRFVNELGRRDHVTNDITAKCQPFQGVEGNPITAAMLLTQEMIDKFSAPAAGFYIFKGLIKDVKDLAGVAELLNVPVSTLEKTLDDYERAADEGEDEFGKVAFPTVPNRKTDKFYVAFVTPTLHYCMGGIQINNKAEVQQVITAGNGGETKVTTLPGVYAAGEVTGGVHGNNRLGGNSLLECVVYGRIAAFHASHYKP